MKGAASIFRFLVDADERGERTALVTITGIVGTSSRAPGTHMAVSETGAFAGSFSGGCVEAAIVGEAIKSIRSGRAELVRFGADSPFIDIRLPCGGGIDFLISPRPPLPTISAVLARLDGRRPATLSLGRDGGIELLGSDGLVDAGWRDDFFVVRHDPELRIVILGQGMETEAMARLALAYGAPTEVFTPDPALAGRLAALGVQVEGLRTPGPAAALETDGGTAVVMFFHDHEWETALLAQVLGQNAFFIGAMGSRQAQAIRLAALRERGVSEQSAARVTGPIGILEQARDPETLALSALSQIAELYRRRHEPDRHEQRSAFPSSSQTQ